MARPLSALAEEPGRSCDVRTGCPEQKYAKCKLAAAEVVGLYRPPPVAPAALPLFSPKQQNWFKILLQFISEGKD